MRTALAIMALFALPFFANAQAGFPERSIWVSNLKPASGEVIKISTVLYNSTDGVVAGTLTFTQGESVFNTQDVSLPAQSSNVISVQWSARAGTHAFSARFVSKDGTAPTQETSVIRISVPESPLPNALQESVSRATVAATQFASSSAPIIQKIAEVVFAKTEAVRNAGIEYLEKKVDPPQTNKDALVNNVRGFVLGTSTKKEAAASSFLHTVGQLAVAAGLFIMRSLVLFYPLLALIFFVGLYIIYKTVRRPH